MAILEHEVRSMAQSGVTGLRRHLFTRDQYNTMADAGIFGDSRIELIEGELIEMAPIGHLHAAVTHPLAMLLDAAFGPEFTVRTQVPIALGDDLKPSVPQPDVAVATGHWRDYTARDPGASDIRLLVEIADSSLSDDRRVKALLYASAGIPEYWIVNLIDNQLEVYRRPSEKGYASVEIIQTDENVEPLYAPGKLIAVADILP